MAEKFEMILYLHKKLINGGLGQQIHW